ncbi:MAG: glycosyltransferase family 2 protein, partial [Candidatus Falkowbacteria bacterium]|nr:glycosyltransferase family 2 protein [Candidatus Falkowbacteria bacterium]
SIILFTCYWQLKKNLRTAWAEKCRLLGKRQIKVNSGATKEFSWEDLLHLIILPTYGEGLEIIEPTLDAIANCGYPRDKMIVVFATEEREGEAAQEKVALIRQKYGNKFGRFLVTVHPDNIIGELKGKGANQAWAAKKVKEEIIDRENIDYDKILVNVFDIDTVIQPDYFYCLDYKFLTVASPYRASYQPIPVYHNNIWQAPFFARVAASSNTFWQMMQQIRQEKLATYSSHSMTWQALVDIGFWSTTMVSEDSRIFWHCFCYYAGDYRVEPLYFPVSMDVCMGERFWQTAKMLYKQQRRWGWGVENLPYLSFNTIKNWRVLPLKKMISRILIQIYGFHSWATNALIIAIIGWMPLLLGGARFEATVLSTNLPFVARTLMIIAMVGLLLSSILSTLLLPPKPKNFGFSKRLFMLLEWALLPVTIIVFGSLPGLEAQTRLMFGKYLGFFVTSKKR